MAHTDQPRIDGPAATAPDRQANPLSRRRFLAISAGLIAGAGLVRRAEAAAPVTTWSGQALGAHATMRLLGDSDAARATFAAVEAEIARLEAIFSLYTTTSELARLNAAGRLHAPSPELLEVIGLSRAVHRATGGLFDPTVQPLFALYAQHFADPAADPRGPSVSAVADALAPVGLDRVEADTDSVRFARPGMAMTLNGVAQGYVTDRIAALLSARGLGNLILDIGEIRAGGAGTDGRGWPVGLAVTPSGPAVRHIRLTDRAVATSMPLGTTLDAAGTVGHIFDPRRGWTGGRRGAVSVTAPTAAMADAVSTAAVLMDDHALASLDLPGVAVA